MGVNSLWDIVGPAARPVRVEALRNKQLAVDASIWIYQFMKAVRDTEGNQLQNSHIVGFFRRICKLLFLGVKPVFVFDGGVPALKRDTIRKRREKREENKESIEQIAQKLLAKQLQEYADGKASSFVSSPKKRASNKVTVTSKATRRNRPTDEIYFDTYYDDVVEKDGDGEGVDGKEKPIIKTTEKESRMFKGQDDYDLPNLKEGIKVNAADNRLMTDYEYDRLTKDISDDLDDIDLDKINPQSKEFERLPLSTQYIVLSHLRLRSRLRMGYTKTQLQALFPDPMEFSKFQIKMVQKRNYFTQKIMNVTGMDGDADEDIISRRIASDKNRAYNLKKVGNGYALAIEKPSESGGSATKPIFLEDMKVDPKVLEIKSDDELTKEEDDDIDWDDVEVVEATPVQNSSVVVENPLFVYDNDGEEADSDEESVEMEDVTNGAVFSTDLRSVPNAEPWQGEEEDEITKQIKYLYEYSAKNNKKKGTRAEEHIILSDEDMDEYHEMQVQQVEDDELKRAIEESKKDYLNMLDDEMSGTAPRDTVTSEPPIILSTSTLAKTLKLPNFSMKSNILFGGGAHANKKEELQHKSTVMEGDEEDPVLAMLSEQGEQQREAKIPEPVVELTDNTDVEITKSEAVETVEEIKESEKPRPLPQWFTSPNNFDEKDSKPVATKRSTLTEDEKAGLVSYGDVENYFSSDDDDVEVLGNINKEGAEVIDLDREESLQESPVVVVDKESEEGDANEQRVADSHPKKVTFANSDKLEEVMIPTLSKSVDIAHVLSGKQTDPPPKAVDSDDNFEFSDDEDVNLLLEMENEKMSYKNFLGTITGDATGGKPAWTIDDEAALQERLRRQKRDSDEVSTKMIHEVQDLLSRFGIPFITAPMEAEAQCAELKLIGLVDGIITDDSDCFLFGGDRVYKNLFNDKNYVECYQIEDIDEELGLSRDAMIDLAVLLGSDYTEGIKGVGKVMAMEILGEFKTLQNFKDWWIDYQNGKIEESKETPTKRRIRKKLTKKLFLSNDFPNKLIYEAYLYPDVDHDRTRFQWGQPDLEKLRTFLRFYVGWKTDKVDEILLPVLKSMGKPQTTIEEFFAIDSIQRRRKLDMSKRITDAVEKLKKYRKKTHREGYDKDTPSNTKKPKR